MGFTSILLTPSNIFSSISIPSSRAISRPSSTALRCSLSVADMVGTTVFPLDHCKTLHLVRHAQGIHNVAGDMDYEAYLSPEFFDAQLTPLGWQQVDNLRKHVHSSGLAKRIELVITSPLLRAMQTAVGVFGGDGYVAGVDAPPLMVANAWSGDRSAISSLNYPPFIAVESCRERVGVHPGDKRRSISEYRPIFPAIDFSQMENDVDTLWKTDIREDNENVAARGMKLFNWLWTRKEREIVIVSHSGFLYYTLSKLGTGAHPLIKAEFNKRFDNCELRSLVMVDRGMVGMDASTTCKQRVPLQV